MATMGSERTGIAGTNALLFGVAYLAVASL